MTNHNCLVLSVDFDGCSDNAHGRLKILTEVQAYLQHHPNIQKIVIIIGSLRQSLFLDKYTAIDYAAYHNSSLVSCKLIGESFLEDLRRSLPSNIHISFDPLLTSDIYNHLQAGTTFQAMQTYFSRDIKEVSHVVSNKHGELIDLLLYPQPTTKDLQLQGSRELIDFTKISIMYLQMQHMANLMPEDSITFRFYDDREDIHRKLNSFFHTHPYSIPKNMTWNSVLNNSQDEELSTKTMLDVPLKGEGPIESRYMEILLHLLETCPFDMIDDHINQQILEQILVQAIQKTNAQTSFIL